jgi:hypothetical protein
MLFSHRVMLGTSLDAKNTKMSKAQSPSSSYSDKKKADVSHRDLATDSEMEINMQIGQGDLGPNTHGKGERRRELATRGS